MISARHQDTFTIYPPSGLYSLQKGVQRFLLKSFQKRMSQARQFLLKPRCALARSPSIFSQGPVRAPRSEIPFPKQTTRHRPAVALMSLPTASVLRDAHGTSIIVGMIFFLPLCALRWFSSLSYESCSRVSMGHRPLLLSESLSCVSATRTVSSSLTSSASISPVALGDQTASPESPYKT